MIIKRLACFALFTMVGISSGTFADDTELYVFESSSRTGARPKVLIIFDNSGSMATLEEDNASAYDPDRDPPYEAVGGANSFQERMVYYTKGGLDNTALPTPDSPSEARRFLMATNGCHVSWEALAKYGRFTGYLREYVTKGKTGTWEEIPDNNGANIEILDCWEDIEAEDSKNAPGVNDGFPVDGKKVSGNAVAYNYVTDPSSSEWADAVSAAKNTYFGTGKAVTLFTDNYLRWYTLVQRGELPVVPKTRLDIAKDSITSFINTNTSVDFGLAVFNMNYEKEGERDGGRIVSGIRQMASSNKSNLLSTIDQLPAETNTPLCETLFEAYKYFSGGAVTFGHKDSDYNFTRGDKYVGNNPSYDTSIEKDGYYISPFKVCPDIAYVIYITDGVPTVDSFADSNVKTLTATGSSDGDYSSFSEGLASESYLPALASYMYQNDLVHKLDADGVDQKQNVVTFTIGFSKGAEDAAPLLKETAKRGGGNYISATSGIDLQNALDQALTSILAIDSSFTSPSIASNNFDRTQSFNAAYFAMFLPGKGPRWSGNLKKLKVTDGGDILDKFGTTGLNADNNISELACTYWSKCLYSKDANKVQEGGVAEVLRAGASRKLLFNGPSGITPMSLASLSLAAGDLTALATYMKQDEISLASTIEWLSGKDVDDDNHNGNLTEIRSDVMGDPLHSKPLAINFGSEGNPDIRIILGTNQGLVHMFKDMDTSVEESWAFMPYELLPNVPRLRKNDETGGHIIYGMDLSPVSYTKTGSNGLEKAWVFLGMRRGGYSYYALDITNPDDPKFMWRISNQTSGFSDLGQTWSEPVVTTIPGYSKPVLIIGGGYDISYDSSPSTDPLGRSIYVVDAETGALLHTFGATGDTVISGLADSIPNAVAVLDSNNDGVSDRIYATDLGANVWRIDMPSADKSTWTAFKFADLGGSTDSTNRNFFAEAAIAQTVFTNLSLTTTTEGGTTTTTQSYQNIPYDAVVVGSGDRTRPASDTTTNDMFFTLQDRNVVTRSFDGTTNPIPQAITLDALYDVTSSGIDTEAEELAFSNKLGWFYDFTAVGEKSLSAALIFNGKVYFTTYVPPSIAVSDTVCSSSGSGRLYVFDLHKATRTQAYIEIGERLPDSPQPIATEDGVYIIVCTGADCDQTTMPPTEPPSEQSDLEKVGEGLGANKIYYHVDE
ncbi:rRNA (guanine-N1)-methyltransferase [Shewanella cyperi]|uniref:rRNA (Guanine-N1)-methyltransferase n=1 Tax=Shewanella cyperi TaxID=2814292 RepID=A0A975AL62_9GAMM|nr:PilC/PilY family type IV pilus protein [Shewanella cyperi]QSX30870.1 rRNA (guanine-N1)-methyltransferase [Shewanella cyperi]